MRLLRSVRARLFLVVWVVSALHFATNIVREHYPAFALAEHGDLRCDEWAGLHPDLFQHRDGHWYANNNVGAALVAAPILWVAQPLLDRLEAIGKRQAAGDPAPAAFESEYALRQKFMAQVRARGLHLRFGAAAALTAALVMAPAAALLALLVHDELRRRLLRSGFPAERAVGLTLLFAFATPLVFRSALLNHNQLEALAGFAAFVLIARGADAARLPRGADATRPHRLRTLAAGLLAGATVLLDYSGLVLLAALWIWQLVVVARRSAAVGSSRPDSEPRMVATLRAGALFGAGALASLALLWATQWWQFGDPFTPAQRWMPDAHFSVRGWHGFALPSPDLLWRNLLDPSFGLFAFAPLLLLAFARPARAAPDRADVRSDSPPLLARRERLFVFALSAAFLLFSAANQFTRLQWNTGFRALAPLVPFLFLAAGDALVRMAPRTLALVALPCVLHAWAVAMARATPPLAPHGFADSTIARSWSSFLHHGIELPWLTVWRQTQPGGGPAWAAAAAPLLVLATTVALWLLWRTGARAASRAGARAGGAA